MGACCPGLMTWVSNPEVYLEGQPMTSAACAEFDVNKLAGEWLVVRRKLTLADLQSDPDCSEPAKDLRLQLNQQTPDSIPPHRLAGLCAFTAVWWAISAEGSVTYLKELVLEQSNLARLTFDIQVADSLEEQGAIDALTTQLALKPPLKILAFGQWAGCSEEFNRPYDWFWLSGKTDRQLMLLVRSTEEYNAHRLEPEEAMRALAVDLTHLCDLPVARVQQE